MSEVQRKFATILATDCVSFSKHMAENEEGTLSSLNSCRSIIDEYIEKHGGEFSIPLGTPSWPSSTVQ